jgi:photosystem II stability/assembly factor-like uncharacterized protein
MIVRLKTALRVAVLLTLVLVLAGPFSAQNAPADPNQALVKHLKWRNIGPANMIGRISAFEGLESDFTTVLVAGASGGVFKSVNAGTTWEPIFDKYGSSSIGDVKFFQKDSKTIWVGTGESCVRNSVSWGDGIYKSTDGGKTFTRMGLETTQTIGRIRTHPTDPDTVYVAASGHPWAYTGDRGLFKTTDGGKTWTKLTQGLPNDGKTGAVDLVMDPTNPDILYVSFWQRLRQPWRFDSGGPNGGIFKTTDGGRTWTKLTKGLPTGDTGRIGLAISRSNPKVLMTVIEATYQPTAQVRVGEQTKPNPDYADMTKLGTGVYRSEDGGATWQYMNRMNNRPFYYSHIYINPLEDKWVYFLTTSLNFSSDGGKTWTQLSGLHPDFHAMWLDPTNKNRFYVGQDGGASITYDNGKTWVFYDNLCLAQFYAVSADMRDPYYVYGGLQDNGTWGGPSMNREGMILTDYWFNIGGGDGFHTQNDLTDWRTAYCESQNGSALRVNVETREMKSIRPSQANVVNYKDYYPPEPAAKPGEKPSPKPGAKAEAKPAPKAPAAKPQAKAEPVPTPEEAMMAMAGRTRGPLRFNWSTPIIMSPHNPRTVYIGANHLIRSLDRGDHWMIISPDLTTNDKTKYAPEKVTGGITRDDTGAETHCTIITISESPLVPGLIWVGTDDGNVELTRNDGATWTNVRPAVLGVPKGLWVSRVEASRFDAGTCYLTFDGHRSDDFKTYVFKTTDYGKTWTNITGNLPGDQPAYVIREDLKNKDLLFLGTEYGVFFSRDGGKAWTSLSLNLPVVPVHDLLIHPRDNDLIAATHGRGIWIMDDITALRNTNDSVLGQDAYLFEANKPGTRWLQIGRGGYSRGDLFFKGENPPAGALLDLYLKAKPDKDKPATLEIVDATGSLKTTYILDAAEAGINRVAWDLRFDPPAQTVQGMVTTLKNQIQAALQRTDLTAEQKTTLQNAQAKLEQFGTNFRKVMEVRRSIMSIIGGGMMFGGGGGMGFGGRGMGGGQAAEPGTYAVRLTVGGKTLTGKVSVRLDPIQEAAGN